MQPSTSPRGELAVLAAGADLLLCPRLIHPHTPVRAVQNEVWSP